MKTNPRDLAIEITGWVVAKGAPIDKDAYQLGASLGQLMYTLMGKKAVPKHESEGERRRRKFLYETKLRSVLGQAIIGVLHYANARGTYLSFEEAENYVRGVEHEKLGMLTAFAYQNVSSIYKANVEWIEDADKDPGGEVFFRVGSQRFLNTIFAIIANLGLGDPIQDVLQPEWIKHAQ